MDDDTARFLLFVEDTLDERDVKGSPCRSFLFAGNSFIDTILAAAALLRRGAIFSGVLLEGEATPNCGDLADSEMVTFRLLTGLAVFLGFVGDTSPLLLLARGVADGLGDFLDDWCSVLPFRLLTLLTGEATTVDLLPGDLGDALIINAFCFVLLVGVAVALRLFLRGVTNFCGDFLGDFSTRSTFRLLGFLIGLVAFTGVSMGCNGFQLFSIVFKWKLKLPQKSKCMF